MPKYNAQYRFERCLVAVSAKLAEKMYPSFSDFARKAFAGYSNPENTWRLVRNQPSTNPRGVSLFDAYNIASALNLQLEDLCFKTRKELEEGWSEQDDLCKKARKKPGRLPVKEVIQESSLL